jgi:chemotaxis-related protein WspB
MLVLAFQIGNDRLVLDVRRITEVVPRVPLQRIAGSPPWLAGLFIYRGQVVPVLDLHRLVGAGDCPPHLSSRIILAPHQLDGAERLLGLLAAQVADIREIQAPSQSLTNLTTPGQPDLGPVLVDGGKMVRLLQLDRLLPEAVQRQLAIVPRELPA